MHYDVRRPECDDAVGKLWEYLDAELDRDAAGMVAAHLETCERCRCRMLTRRRLLIVVKASGRTVRAPARLRERVLAGRIG